MFVAFLIMVALTVLVSQPLFTGTTTESHIVTEENGFYDLTRIDDSEKTVIKLIPERHIPNTYLTPESVMTTPCYFACNIDKK